MNLMLKKPAIWQIVLVLLVIGSLAAGFLVSKLGIQQLSTIFEQNSRPQDSGVVIQETDKSLITNNIRLLVDMNIYTVKLRQNTNLVGLSEISGTAISEQLWSLNIDSKEYKFKTLSTKCEFDHTDPQIKVAQMGYGSDDLETSANYYARYSGLVEPLSEAKINSMSDDCKRVWGNLRVNSEDVEQLRRFFESGDTSNFETDSSGVVDLSKVITLYLAIPVTN